MKIVRKTLTAIVPILVLGLAGVLIHALSGGEGKKAGEKLSPEETVLLFNRYMLSGEVDSAGRLCTEQMSGHIGRFSEVRAEISSRDSSVLSAAERMMDSVGVDISGAEKTDDGRVLVHYRITSPIPGFEGIAKVAELAEHSQHGEGGSVWKIEKIRNGEAD